jgi:hypothetical protein
VLGSIPTPSAISLPRVCIEIERRPLTRPWWIAAGPPAAGLADLVVLAFYAADGEDGPHTLDQSVVKGAEASVAPVAFIEGGDPLVAESLRERVSFMPEDPSVGRSTETAATRHANRDGRQTDAPLNHCEDAIAFATKIGIGGRHGLVSPNRVMRVMTSFSGRR